MHRCLRLSSAELSSTSPIGKHGPMVMRSSHQSHGMPTEGPQSRNIAGARQWPWTSRPPLRREPSALDLSTSGGHSCGCPFGPPRIASVWRHQRSRPEPNGQPPESSHLEHARKGLEAIEAIGARRFIPLFNDVIARFRLHDGDVAGALELLEESWNLSREAGVSFAGPVVLGAMALATTDSGRRFEALLQGE